MVITWLVTKIKGTPNNTSIDVTVEFRGEGTAMDAPPDLTLAQTFDSASPTWTQDAVTWINQTASVLGNDLKAKAVVLANTYAIQRQFVGKTGTVVV